MYTIIRKSETQIKKVFDEKRPLNEIVNIDDKVSLNVTEVIDYHEKTTAAYNRIYYIYDGLMRLRIKDNEINLQKGDACFVEKGTRFELNGTFKVIVVSQPMLHL